MKLVDFLPDFAEELTELLITAGEPVLAATVSDLEIVDSCGCNADFCASFYTAPKPLMGYGRRYRGIGLEPEEGQVMLDLVEDRIMSVEVHDRQDIKEKLDMLFPPKPTPMDECVDLAAYFE